VTAIGFFCERFSGHFPPRSGSESWEFIQPFTRGHRQKTARVRPLEGALSREHCGIRCLAKEMIVVLEAAKRPYIAIVLTSVVTEFMSPLVSQRSATIVAESAPAASNKSPTV